MTNFDTSLTGERQRRSRLRGPLISLGVLVVLVLMAEFLVRVLTDTHPPLLVVDAAIGRRYMAGIEVTIHDPESRRDVDVSFNQQGFRFDDLPFEKPAGTRRVAVIGDSMIVAMQVDREESACAVMERELRANAPEGEAWEVLNFGVAGSGTLQEYVLHREVARRYQPDHVILVFFVGNDFSDNNPLLSNRKRLYFDLDQDGGLVQRPYPSMGVRLGEFLNRYSRLYIWQKEFFANRLRGEQLGLSLTTLEERHAWHGEHLRASEYVFVTEGDEKAEHGWALTRAGVQALARDVADDGALLTVVLLPNSQLVHREEFEYLSSVAGEFAGRLDQENPGRRLREIAESAGARFLDLTSSFREAAPSRSELAREEWLFHNGRGHLNVSGNALLAQGLAAEAREVRDHELQQDVDGALPAGGH